MDMSDLTENTPGGRIPGNRQGGVMDPGTPRSELRAKFCEGPKPGGGLPTGSPPCNATVDVAINREDNPTGENAPAIQSILNRYLGDNAYEASTSRDISATVAQEDNMSVSSAGGPSRKRIRDAESDRDSDIGYRTPRGNKMPIRDSDDDEPIEILSDSPEAMKKANAKKIRTRYRDPKANLDADLNNLVFSECPSRMVEEDFLTKDADEVATTANDWLNDMETVRTKSRQLNGRLSGILKDRICCMRTLIRSLVEKVKTSGDVSYLRRRNDELAGQLREAKKEEGRLQGFLKEADAKAARLSAELLDVRKRIGSMSAESDKPLPQRQPKNKQTATPVKKAPITPIREKAPKKKDPNVVETLMEYDDHFAMISNYDDKITQFEELLSRLRSDLYGSMETIAEKVAKTAGILDPTRSRGVPKIIENIQLVPPRPAPGLPREQQEEQDLPSDLESWTEVVNKKKQRKQVRIAPGGDGGGPSGVAAGPGGGGSRPLSVRNGTRRRAPRNAAVAIKLLNAENSNGEPLSYADVIRMAKEKVNLRELGITNPSTRPAANGSYLIEIAGPDGPNRADTLASRLREAIGDIAVVSRPVVKADLRISGFDVSVISDEIIASITENGDCLASDVRVGSFRPMRNGLMMTWVQCPLSAAIKVSKRKKLNLGWSVARVELLSAKPVQCFKCWEFGHVRNGCKSAIDRTGHCFRCGGTDHKSYTCTLDFCCAICSVYGYDTAHRIGSSACLAMARGGGTGDNRLPRRQ